MPMYAGSQLVLAACLSQKDEKGARVVGTVTQIHRAASAAIGYFTF